MAPDIDKEAIYLTGFVMKILWLSHVLSFPPIGGITQRSFNLIKELAKYHEVSLISFNQKAIRPTDEEVERAVNEFRKFCNFVHVLPIPSDLNRYTHLSLVIKCMFTKDPYTINWLKSDEMFDFLSLHLKSNKYDLIFFDTISLAPYLRLFKDEKFILDHHNIESDMMLRRAKKEKNLLKKLYFYIEGLKLTNYENKLCPDFDFNVTCSELDSIRIKRRLPLLKTAEIPNGTDIQYFSPSHLPLKQKTMIFAGSMNWYPNQDAMLYFTKQIWPLLSNAIPDAKMTIIGSNPPSSLVEFSNSDRRITVTGFVDDVRPYIDEAMVYLCPIRDGGGTKLKILNALAMEKAIVADPIACEGIDVREGENVLFATTPDEYVHQITRLFNDKDLITKLGKNGRKLVESKYSYEVIGKKLAKVCEKSLNIT